MLPTIKEVIKSPIINKCNDSYSQRMDEQYVSYNDWILRKEAKYRKRFNIVLSEDVESNRAEMGDETADLLEVMSIIAHNDANGFRLLVTDPSGVDPYAYSIIEKAMQDPQVMVVYGDEDEWNSDETIRMNPVFRPEYSPDTLRNYLYMGNVIAIRNSVFVEGEDIYDTVVRSCEGLARNQVKHLHYMLYHSHCHEELYGYNRFHIPFNGKGSVSIVIPSKDNPEVLSQLLKSILKLTAGVDYEIVVIDNGSNEENKAQVENIISSLSRMNHLGLLKASYIYAPQDFNFARIVNQGVAASSCPYVLLLNDDCEIRDSKWLLRMMAYAVLPHVGAVGAKLYYPDSRMIQHAGVVNLRLGPVHKLQFKQDDAIYYNHASDMDRNMLAVTGACLLVARSKWDELGGMDEEFIVAFNDVDFCFRLYEAGYYNVQVNTTHLWHYESLSRGDDETAEKVVRLTNERNLLYTKHPNLFARDPFYHPYLSRDILDSNYTFAYQYEWKRDGVTQLLKPVPLKDELKEMWINDCLILSLEQSGDVSLFTGEAFRSKKTGEYGSADGGAESRRGRAETDNIIYLAGYTFIAGSDNSLFEFKLILQNGRDCYQLPVNNVYRPDLEINLEGWMNASLGGFSILIDRKTLKPGRYRVGVVAKGKANFMTLLRWTNRYVRI